MYNPQLQHVQKDKLHHVDNKSVISLDVACYQRQPAYSQPNRFRNIPHQSCYIQSYKHNKHTVKNSKTFNTNNESLIEWTATKEDIAEVRKYGSYEFYLNNKNNVNVVIRYGDK